MARPSRKRALGVWLNEIHVGTWSTISMGILDDFFVHPRSIFLGMLRLRYTFKVADEFQS